MEIYPKTYAEWLLFAEQTLLEKAENNPYLEVRSEANLLLQTVTKRSKSAIFAFSETILSDEELQQLATLLTRRAQGEPMAYILGEKEFWSLPFLVSPATLIPRPDTERLVEVALEILNKRSNFTKKMQILDLGTGTGVIALALASELGNKAKIIGVDKQFDAIVLAEKNRQRLGFNNTVFLQSDWFEAINTQCFDIIVSNPPYIDMGDENLHQGDVRFEPNTALIAKENGLADIRHIIEHASSHLTQEGWLLLEHGWQQAQSVQALFQQHQWDNICTVKDYSGNDRVTLAQWNK